MTLRLFLYLFYLHLLRMTGPDRPACFALFLMTHSILERMRLLIGFQLLLLFSTSYVLGLHTPVARITRRLYSLNMKASIPILSPDSVVGGIKSTVNSINIAPITKLVLSHTFNYSISSLFTHLLKISLSIFSIFFISFLFKFSFPS